jgi:hypothetical protein
MEKFGNGSAGSTAATGAAPTGSIAGIASKR